MKRKRKNKEKNEERQRISIKWKCGGEKSKNDQKKRKRKTWRKWIKYNIKEKKKRMKIFKTDKRKIKWSEAENCNVKKYFNFFLNEKFKQGKK